MKKTLLILDKDNDMFARMSIASGVDVYKAYDTRNLLLKILRRVHLISKLPLFQVWFGVWRSCLDEYDTIVVHASALKAPIIPYIHKRRPQARLILWYWNPVATSIDPGSIPDEYCEKWSFDLTDCREYGLHYNTQFYFSEIEIRGAPIRWDVLFVGKDKGRFEEIMNYKQQFMRMGLKCLFLIMPDSNKSGLHRGKYVPYMPYEDLLNKISGSKAILDVVDSRQTGLTLRPLEALFHEKKLITNHKLIAKVDFYDRQNIFILGIDDIKKLPVFLSTPYKKVPKKIVDKYDFDSWLERFERPDR